MQKSWIGIISGRLHRSIRVWGRSRERSQKKWTLTYWTECESIQLAKKHGSLDGQTPAESAKITVKGRNKWMSIIQNAASSRDSR